MQELSALVPNIKTVTIRSNQPDAEVIKITPLKFRQFSEVAKHVVTFRSLTSENGDLDIMSLVANHGSEVAQVISIALDKDPKWVDSLDLDDTLELVMTIVEVNRDFFSQQLAPKLREMTKRLSAGQA